jgi:hypothetical protein
MFKRKDFVRLVIGGAVVRVKTGRRVMLDRSRDVQILSIKKSPENLLGSSGQTAVIEGV